MLQALPLETRRNLNVTGLDWADLTADDAGLGALSSFVNAIGNTAETEDLVAVLVEVWNADIEDDAKATKFFQRLSMTLTMIDDTRQDNARQGNAKSRFKGIDPRALPPA